MNGIGPLLATVAALALSSPALAEPEFSISLGGNHSTADTVDNPYFVTTLPADEFSGGGPRLSIAMSLSWLVSVEAGWSRFGSESGTITRPAPSGIPCVPGDPCDFDSDFTLVSVAKYTGEATWIAFTPRYRTESFDLSAKLGWSKVTRDLTIEDETFVVDREVNDDVFLIGGAATYWFTDRIGASLDVERLGSKATQFGASVRFRF